SAPSIWRGCFIASPTACLVMALNTTRSTVCFLSAFFCFSTSSTCQEIASPSRSGSVARIRPSAPLTARAMSFSRFWDLSSTSHSILKSWFGSTEPSLAGRSRTWPNEARTSYPGPRYLLIVLALAGDSTTTIFIEFQVVGGDYRVENRQTGHSDSPGTWVTQPTLSNREGRFGVFWRPDLSGERRYFQYNLKENSCINTLITICL